MSIIGYSSKLNTFLIKLLHYIDAKVAVISILPLLNIIYSIYNVGIDTLVFNDMSKSLTGAEMT